MSKLEDIVAFSDIQVTAVAFPYGGSSFEVEISSVSLRFVENGIPKAILKVALGESPQQSGGITTAKAHIRAKDLERRDKIQVLANFKGHQSPNQQWENNGRFKLFEGYLSRPAYTMGTGAASLILEVDHWLSDLATADKLTYIAAANSAAHHTRPVIVDSFTGGQVCFDGEKATYDADAPDKLWETIKELFGFLADRDRLSAKTIIELGIDDAALVKNTLAKQALNLMDQGHTVTMALKGSVPGLRDRVREGVCSMIASRETGSSFWETLLSLGRDFMFSVVPTIYTATCAPVIKTINRSWRVIEASEFDQIQFGGQIRGLPIRSVGLYSSCNWFTIDTRGLSQKFFNNNSTLVGYWDLAKDHPGNEEVRSGQIMMFYTPGWMKNAGADFSKCAPQNTPRFGPIKTAANSKAQGESPTIQAINERERETSDQNNADRIGNKLAQVMLSDITWRNRTGSISGRLRFDVAPGSSIAVEIIGKNVPFYRSGGDNYLYAHVYQVDIDIDAIAPRASTTFHLSHMRTDAEEKEFSSIVVSEHPLYDQVWDGTTLLDGAE